MTPCPTFFEVLGEGSPLTTGFFTGFLGVEYQFYFAPSCTVKCWCSLPRLVVHRPSRPCHTCFGGRRFLPLLSSWSAGKGSWKSMNVPCLACDIVRFDAAGTRHKASWSRSRTFMFSDKNGTQELVVKPFVPPNLAAAQQPPPSLLPFEKLLGSRFINFLDAEVVGPGYFRY